MAFGRFPRAAQAKPFSDINVTPLVDVMLVLLVIFILTAPLLTSAIRLDLPQSKAAQAGEAPEALSLSLKASGELFINDKPILLAALPTQLQQLANQKPNLEVQLRVDQAVPYGQVLELMSLAQLAGLSRIGFVTAPGTEAQADAQMAHHRNLQEWSSNPRGGRGVPYQQQPMMIMQPVVGLQPSVLTVPYPPPRQEIIMVERPREVMTYIERPSVTSEYSNVKYGGRYAYKQEDRERVITPQYSSRSPTRTPVTDSKPVGSFPSISVFLVFFHGIALPIFVSLCYSSSRNNP